MNVNELIVEEHLTVNRTTANTTFYTTAASTITLVFGSMTYYTIFTGSIVGQIIKLPDALTIGLGYNFYIYNSSSAIITIQNFSGVTLTSLGPNGRAHYINRNNSTSAGIWDVRISSSAAFSGTAPVLSYYGANAAVGRYLEVVPGVNTLSAPFPVAVNSTIIAVVLAADANSTGTLGIFKTTNLTTPIYSISLSANRLNSVLNLNIPLSQGDQLAWRVTAGTISKPYAFTYISAV